MTEPPRVALDLSLDEAHALLHTWEIVECQYSGRLVNARDLEALLGAARRKLADSINEPYERVI